MKAVTSSLGVDYFLLLVGDLTLDCRSVSGWFICLGMEPFFWPIEDLSFLSMVDSLLVFDASCSHSAVGSKL